MRMTAEKTRLFRAMPIRRTTAIERALFGLGVAGIMTALAAILWPTGKPLAPKTDPLATLANTHATSMTGIVERGGDDDDAGVDRITPSLDLDACETHEHEADEGTDNASELALVPSTTEDLPDFLALADKELDVGNTKAALVALRMALHVEGPSPGLLLEIARVAGEAGDRTIEGNALDEAIALDPKDPTLWLERARVRFSQNDFVNAEKSARQALVADPDYAPAHTIIGRSALAQSQWQRAERAFREAVRLNPGDFMPYNNLGLTYVYMKRGDDAVDALETSAALYGKDPPAFVSNNLGLARELAADLEGAREAFEAALRADAKYTRARVNLGRIASAIANA